MKDRLVEVLRSQWTSPIDALQLAGCFSLSQRCGELRRAGVSVMDRWKELPSGKRVKEFHIVG